MTVSVNIPATIKVELSYSPIDNYEWYLSSGGAGLYTISPGRLDPRTNTETFLYKYDSYSTLNLIFKYQKPGPIVDNPIKTFKVLIKGS